MERDNNYRLTITQMLQLGTIGRGGREFASSSRFKQVFRVLLNLTLISGERSGPYTRFPHVGIVWKLRQHHVSIRAQDLCESESRGGCPGLHVLWSLWTWSNIWRRLQVRAQALCESESRGGCPGLPVLNSPYGLCGREATFEEEERLLSWCLMSSDVIWHIRDKLWPMPKHGSIRKVYACLAVTCHLHFWQNDRDFLRATVVTRGWNGYRNKSQHRKSTLEKKILPPFQQGFEPATFQSRVRRSNHWAIPAP